MFTRILRHDFTIALAILTFLWLLFFWRLMTPAELDRQIIVQNPEFMGFYYGMSSYQAERIGRGEFPLWNPYDFAGDSFVANIEAAPLYPLRIAAILLARGNWTVETFQMEIVFHYWLASVLMYLFLRLHLRRLPAALIGSVLFAYGGYLTGFPMLQVNILESHIWLPLMLTGVHLSLTRPNWHILGCFITGIATALSFLGGFPQTTMQITYLTLGYLAFYGWMNGVGLRGIVWRTVLFGLIAGGLSAIQLLPLAELVRLTARVTEQGYFAKSNGYSIPFLMQAVYPQFFGFPSYYLGLAGLSLAIGAGLRREKRHFFWLIVIVMGVLLSLGGNSIVYDFFYVFIPGFSIFRGQERIVSVVSFALVMLASYQIEWILQRGEERPFARLVYGFAAVLAAIFIGAMVVILVWNIDPMQSGAVSSFGFAGMISLLLAGWMAWQRGYGGASWHVAAVLLFIIVVDLFTVGTRSYNFTPDLPQNRVGKLSSLEPYRTNDLLWRLDGAASLSGFGTYFRLPDIYGVTAFELESMNELRKIPVDRFWEVLAVRYVTSNDVMPDILHQSLGTDTNLEGDSYSLYELENPRPFAHLVYDSRFSEYSPAFAREIMSDSRVNLREIAIVTEPMPFELPIERPEVSEIRDLRFITPEQLEMTVSTGADALLTVSIPNYPGWKAFVDGQQVEIIDTYAGLIGVPVHAGENLQVRLEFSPDSLWFGMIISAITLLGVAVGIVVNRRKKQI